MAAILEPTTSTPPSESQTLIPPRSKPLANFHRLAPDVSLYTPPSTAPPAASNHPTTIVFCAWMNASIKHIDYYTRNYIALYPSTRILVLRISTTQFVLTSESTRRSQISTAVDALLASSSSSSDERLVIHAISNGGCKRLYGIAGLYLERTGKPIPAKAIIHDCAPGIPKFRRDMHALMLPARNMSLPRWLPVYFFTLLITSFVYASVNWMPYWWWGELVWKPTFLFNDPTFSMLETVKGYVYSREDLSIDYRDVEAHAKTAEEKGYRVVKKEVLGAEHAQMWKGKGGEKDYWGWVKGVWEMGLEKK